MFKKFLLAFVACFVAMGLMDWVIHGFILSDLYEQTKELWRPENEMKVGVMYLTSLIFNFVFVYLYWKFVSEKSPMRGVMYGLLLGIATGVGMGYGTYGFMPIPYALAFGWFIATVVEFTIIGLITGLIVKE